MRVKLLVWTAIFFCFLALSAKNVSAEQVAIIPDKVTELNQTIQIKLTGLDADEEYKIISDQPHYQNERVTLFTFVADSSGSYTSPVVCGDGLHKDQVFKAENFGKLKNTCNSSPADGDYFHGGRTYKILVTKGGEEFKKDFVVERFTPNYKITNTAPKPADDINAEFSGLKPRTSDWKRNNYVVSVMQSGSNSPLTKQCGNSPTTLNMGKFLEGSYIAQLHDQDSEDDDSGKVYSSGGPGSDCDRGAYLTEISFSVAQNGGSVGQAGTFASGRNPCQGGSCNTAIGPIPTTLKDFSTKILSIATGLAGGIAFILMVVGAIRVLVSQGDPQKLSAGREMLVGALAGLLFIIFSVLILRFVGINLLGGIPGVN